MARLLLPLSFAAALLPAADDELAYMLAHEMGHVLAQHTREFASAARYFVDNGRARASHRADSGAQMRQARGMLDAMRRLASQPLR